MICSCTLTSWMYCNTLWFLGGFPFLSTHSSWFLTDASAADVELKHLWATSRVVLHFALCSNGMVYSIAACYRYIHTHTHTQTHKHVHAHTHNIHTHTDTHTHTNTTHTHYTHTLSLKPSHITVNSLFSSLNSSRRGPDCSFNCTLSMCDIWACLWLTLSSQSYTATVYWSTQWYTT